MSTPSSEHKDLIQVEESSIKRHKKHPVTLILLFSVITVLVAYMLAFFYLTHVRHDSAISEYTYKGRGMERFFPGEDTGFRLKSFANDTYYSACQRGEWWTHKSGVETLGGNPGREQSEKKGTILYQCLGNTDSDFINRDWSSHDNNNFFNVYSDASESTFYIWAEVFIVDGASYTRSTEAPSEARWVAQVTWVWDSHKKTLEPLFSFHDLSRDEPSQGYRNINPDKTRISAEEFFTHSNASWEQLDNFAHELLYDRFLAMYFDSNPESRYSIDNLGDITVIEKTHKEAPKDFNPEQLGQDGL